MDQFLLPVVAYCILLKHFHESQIPKIQTEASVVINLFFKMYIYLSFPVTSISLISFIRMFAPLLCCYILWSIFEMFVFGFKFLRLLSSLSLFLLIKFVLIKIRLLSMWKTALGELKRCMLLSYLPWVTTDLTSWLA